MSKPKKVTSPWVCPECGSKATKVVNLNADSKAIGCQVCGHKYDAPSAPVRAVNSCHGCANLHRATESWEMPHIWWWECLATNSANLRSFPFRRTKCPHWRAAVRPLKPDLDDLLRQRELEERLTPSPALKTGHKAE